MRMSALSAAVSSSDPDKLHLAFADKTCCARVATGPAALPGGAFKASPCLVEDASDVSLFVDHDGAGYLIWGGGSIAKLAPGFVKLAAAQRSPKPDPSLFAKPTPVGQDGPVPPSGGPPRCAEGQRGPPLHIRARRVAGGG